MRQIDEAVNAIFWVEAGHIRTSLEDLDGLLGRAQNSPPDGEADGTIDETRYNLLRKIERALRELVPLLDQWKMGRTR